METSDFILALVFFSISILYGAVIWYAVASWLKYRFSAWWLLALVLLFPLAILLFPLYSSLRYNAAKKMGKPQSEIERNLLYNRMSWALIVCCIITNIATRFILKIALPNGDYVNELQLCLTTISIAIAFLSCLWAVRRRQGA